MFTRTNKAISALILTGASVWIMTPAVLSAPITSEYPINSLNVVQGGALISYHSVLDEPLVHVKKVLVTAYTSSVDETDDSPTITASGNTTHTGIVASNFLPFGTKVRFPELFGDKVFTIEDRMNKRFQDRMDVWFPTKTEAKRFGLKLTEVEIEI